MRLRRFYLRQELSETQLKSLETTITITSQRELVHQLKNVFRFENGEHIILFNNTSRDFLVKIEKMEKDNLTFSVISVSQNNVKPSRDVYLFASIIKKDNFEWVAQKATELGVSYIIPVLSSRSEKKDLNFERIQKIIVEAAEQSGRATLPVLEEVTTLEESIKKYKHIKSVVWDIEAPKFVSQSLSDITGVYIGPEGGWAESEIELFKENKIPVYSLGPQVLRAETAVIAVLSQIVF